MKDERGMIPKVIPFKLIFKMVSSSPTDNVTKRGVGGAYKVGCVVHVTKFRKTRLAISVQVFLKPRGRD